jgi:hypothetical protein
MSIDEPASGSGAPESASLGDLPAGTRRAIYHQSGNPRRVPGPSGGGKSYLALIPRRSFWRVMFLILSLMAVVALKRSAGGFFTRLIESVAPPSAPAHTAPATTVHLQPGPPPK